MLSAADAGASIPHIRVTNAVAHFAASLPFRVRCSNDLATGLTWASRETALHHREIAPDPPGWRNGYVKYPIIRRQRDRPIAAEVEPGRPVALWLEERYDA